MPGKVTLSYLCRVIPPKFSPSVCQLAAVLLLLLSNSRSFAQQLILSPSELLFGDVFTDAPQSLTLMVTNPGAEPVEVLDTECFHPAFQLSDTAFHLESGSSLNLELTFAPKHNIPHNTEMLFVLAGSKGQQALDVQGRGVYPDAYYAPTQDLSQEALKNALGDLIDGHTSLGYTPARDEMYMVIDNQLVNGAGAPVNTLETCYIGRIAAGYIDRTDAQNSYNVNTEHTWPQSEFGSSEPMQSDLFHLFIADAGANSTRGNLPFGNVVTPDWTSGGAKRGGGLFEPRDAHKGRTSRGMLYFYLRYGNQGSFLSTAQENVLRGWHRDFEVTEVESRRNDDIYAVQGNRNPLIDHPEFDERISSYLGTAVEPVQAFLAYTETEANLGMQPVGADYFYDFVLVANGNQDITLSDVLISHPELEVFSWPVTIAAGESGVIRLKWSPTTTAIWTDTMYLYNSSSDHPEMRLPISGAGTFVGIPSIQSEPEWAAWWSGAGQIAVQFPSAATGELRLYQISGQLLRVLPVEGQLSCSLSALPFSPGLLLLEWRSDRGVSHRKVWVPKD